MTTIEAIILGIIQGLTEFLPVSSSGHLELGQHLMGLTNLQEYVAFDLVCHLGTLLSIFLFFTPRIFSILRENRVQGYQLLISLLPLFPLLAIKGQIKNLFNEPQYLGFFFIVTAFILYVGVRFGRSSSEERLEQRRWGDAFTIGLFQALAILPGVSRSGSTISAARILGWKYEEAITFSFLLAIPTIVGGAGIELLHLFKHQQPTVDSVHFTQYAAGFITSFGIGCLSLKLLFKLAAKQKFMYFVWYCLALGIVTSIYFNFI